MPDKTKMCSRCKAEHPVKDFAPDNKTGGLKSACRKSNQLAGYEIRDNKIAKEESHADLVSSELMRKWV